MIEYRLIKSEIYGSYKCQVKRFFGWKTIPYIEGFSSPKTFKTAEDAREHIVDVYCKKNPKQTIFLQHPTIIQF